MEYEKNNIIKDIIKSILRDIINTIIGKPSKELPPAIYEDLEQAGWQVFFHVTEQRTYCIHQKYGNKEVSVPCARADMADTQPQR